MILISTSIALVAIAMGALLLAKAKQENLGGLFKFISWFVIIMGFLCLVCIGFRGMRHCGMGGEHHGGMQEHCGPMHGEGMRHCMRDKAACNAEMMMGMGTSECCKKEGEGKACCKKGEGDRNMKCMKDSVK